MQEKQSETIYEHFLYKYVTACACAHHRAPAPAPADPFFFYPPPLCWTIHQTLFRVITV